MSTATTTATAPAAPIEVFRKDYSPLSFTVSNVDLDIDIHEGKTTVKSSLKLKQNGQDSSELVLDGDETCVKLVSIAKNGVDLSEGSDYSLSPGKLTLSSVADGDTLTTVVEIVPEDNTQLSGIYKSGSMYCSQCEALGFRRITYYPDRPDNMAVFNVKIAADKKNYPLLLSNGNCESTGELDDGRHYAVWSDPYPKPCYLFAVVAGSLGMLEDKFTTKSGKPVTLRLFSEPHNVGKLDYAMDSLKRSFQWDEDRFGLEYDLGIFNVVAVDDFNMGAMENKSLNIFNTAYVLADQKTATDVDFERVESVIGHEYFHNWTGNRVTCRDWFQLTLKEGLTVFRDQEFSADMHDRAVKRIEDVRGLRARQFAEDAGPMSHPIRPDSYISMDNFYTATVYSKGAEIIRMYQTMLGVSGFRKGMDLYFERHDGQAVTCDDFLSAMADANGVDLSQFGRWYSTSGTPTVTYKTESSNGKFKLTLSQSSKSSTPLHIPISIGLLDKDTGKEVLPTQVLDLKEETQEFTFDHDNVVLSILRDFSAPVKLDGDQTRTDLAFLAANDTDGFNRWEAGQKLYTDFIFETMNGKSSDVGAFCEEAFERALSSSGSDYSLQAYAMTLPSESTLAEDMEVVDPIGIHKARGTVKKALAAKFEAALTAKYQELTAAMAESSEFKVTAEAIGKRRLRNVILSYLCSLPDKAAAAKLAKAHFDAAVGMTDKMAGLSELASIESPEREAALKEFYEFADGDALVLNKWFSVQALADLPDVLDKVKELKNNHPDFTLRNPNRARSLLSAFTMNAAHFHTPESYKFISSVLLELDSLNPQISSRMAGCLISWKRYDAERGAQMKEQLEILKKEKLSDDLYEIVNKGLAA